MSLFTRVSRAAQAFRTAPDMKQLAIDVETLAKELNVVEKQDHSSRLDVHHSDSDMTFSNAWGILRNITRKADQMPAYGDPERDFWLDKLWKQEPIMAGAVYSMSAKMTALKWSITGRRNTALQAAKTLAGAAHMGGYDWGGFQSASSVDFYTMNRGVFWEVSRTGDSQIGKLADLGHIDALACNLTGNAERPMEYNSEVTGQKIRFREGEFIHFSSLVSPRENMFGMGFCAVDRALRALKLLMSLHNYDDEKLANLPPEGVAAISGLTMDEFLTAVRLWQAQRLQDNSLTFPQVLWLIGSQPNTEVKINFQGFSQIPESFNRQEVVTHYVSTLALDFGVDAREFWPISSGSLGTASESEIQHLKAKGKGPGEYITTTERHINGELPDGVDFVFDTQDIEEDSVAAAVAKAWIDAFFPLTTAGGAAEDIITKDDFLRLLSDRGVIPDYLVSDDRIAIEDSDVHNKHFKSDGYNQDITQFYWEKGYLKEKRLPAIVLNTQPSQNTSDVPVAEHKENGFASVEEALAFLRHKEDEAFAKKRNIRGEPIPENEVTRGSRITKNTIRDELERWRNHPVLAPYALTIDEEDNIPEG